jgi:uncharacterized protein (TIGR03435 family)
MIQRSHRFVLLAVMLACAWGVRSNAQTRDAGSTFEVASIKRNATGDLSNPAQVLPNGDVRVTNSRISQLIARGFGVDTAGFEIIGLPSWADSERYDVVAKAKPAATAPEMQQMWRTFLAERMKLAAHYETREKPSYDLVIARKDRRLGPGLKPSTLDCTQPAPARPSPEDLRDMKALGLSRCRTLTIDRKDGTTYAGGITMKFLAQILSGTAGRPVIDKTGLDGYYTVVVRYQRLPQRPDTAPAPDAPPSVFTALEEQLGLKLEPSQTQAQVLVIDHIERPDPD